MSDGGSYRVRHTVNASLTVGLALGSFLAAQAAEILGPSPLSVRTGAGPRAVRLVDLNLDGKPDLAVAATDANRVEIQWGNGRGEFHRGPTLSVVNPVAMLAADVDRDGRPDLEVVSGATDSVHVFLNKIDGTFLESGSYSVGPDPQAIAAGDLDHDEAIDLAVSNRSNSTVSLLYGDGFGAFSPASNLSTGGGPAGLEISDIDGDGTDDIAISATQANAITVIYGDVVGGFTRADVPAGNAPMDVALADMNGDGRDDLVVAAAADSAVLILAGGAGRTFSTLATVPVGAGPVDLEIADVDSDGLPDVLVAESSGFVAGSAASLIGRKADHSFIVLAELSTGVAPASIDAADVDDNGTVDIAVANQASDTVSILSGDGTGEFSSKRLFEVTSAPIDVRTGRFDRDVLPNGSSPLDLVVAEFNPALRLSFLGGDGKGGVKSIREFVQFGPLYFGSALAVADFDGDQIDDVAVTTTGNGAVEIILVGGNAGIVSAGSYPVGSQPFGIVAADFNADGHPDLAVTASADSSVQVLKGGSGGQFSALPRIPVGARPFRLVAGYIDSDRKLDLAVAVADGVDVLRGDSNGNFSAPLHTNTSTGTANARGVALTSLDGDANADLVVANEGADSVSLLRGNGDGTFALLEELPVGHKPKDVAAVDLDGNDRPEIIVANELSDSITVIWLDAAGHSLAVRDFDVGYSPYAIAAGDFDGDKRPDVFVPAFLQYGVTLLRNTIVDRADVNGSNVVNGFDLSRVARAFAAKAGTPSFSADLDIVQDDVVDGIDLSILAAEFGKTVQERFPFQASVVTAPALAAESVSIQQVSSEGDSLRVSIVVDTDQPVAQADILVSFDSNVLKYDGREAGTFFGDIPVVFTIRVLSTGSIEIIASQPAPTKSNRTGNGPATLVDLFFRVVGQGSTVLRFGASSTLTDKDVHSATVAFVDAQVVATAVALTSSTPRLVVQPSSLNFGAVGVGAPTRATLRLVNRGDAAIQVRRIASSTPDLRVPDTRDFEIAPLGFVDVPTVLTPSTVGPFAETLTVTLAGPDQQNPPRAAVPVRASIVAVGVQGK